MTAKIDDTYAEAFKSIYVEFLITARDRTWLEHGVNAVTGHGSSTIMCDCEAGLDRYVGPGGDESFKTPDGRPGAIVQLHLPRFRKDRVEALEKAALARISQNVLACPTAACFNLLDTETYYHMGRKVAYFGNGYQTREERFGRMVWVVPILGGEFVIDRRLNYADGLMGGNLWLFGDSIDSALMAAERGAAAVAKEPGVIMPFPGGIAGSGSKAGSKYKFAIASTYEKFCPTLQDKLGDKAGLPKGVKSVMEIIINGKDLPAIIRATQAAIKAAVDTPGLIMISAGNYGGKLGKSLIYLHPEKQPAST
ncbi:MAG: formylmethanofuran--tetrahydromethanopterin N-formyltransferase [Pseudomonadota bacterium]|nr:formylmethanofuran--tetrahydromethanopterin N-formyltransferase [Pseudomonadota bacterium]